MADPDYVNKLRMGKIDEIRPCISCHEGCMGRIQEYSMLNCAVNPQACRERVTAYTPIVKAKKVMIIGGGVAGCEAARVLAARGHQPELFEKSDKLGGNLLPGGAPDFKEDDLRLADWYTRQLEVYDVPVHYNRLVDANQVHAADYDAVIIATGSKPKVFSLGDDSHVYTAAQILTGERKAGKKTVIIGGGLVGCETALHLAKQGVKVTIIEALDRLMAVNGPLCHANSEMLERLIPYNGIDVVTGAKASHYKQGVLSVVRDETERQISCDSVILSVGYTEENSLYAELQFDVPQLYLLGDAKRVSNIMYAIWDAFEVANHL